MSFRGSPVTSERDVPAVHVSNETSRSDQQPVAGFHSTVEQLMKQLPHLANIFLPTRNQVSSISVYDYSSDMACIQHVAQRQLSFTDEERDPEARRFVNSMRHEMNDNCTSRLIVVEDVCSELVGLLSIAFDLSPEVYAEHLVHSGQPNTYRYTDSDPETWNSRRIAKEHVSLRWYRPGRVSLAPIDEASIEFPADGVLSIEKQITLSKDSRNRPELVQDVAIYPDTNVWRRHLDFRLHAVGALGTNDLIAREERVTLWKRQEEECFFGIVILIT